MKERIISAIIMILITIPFILNGNTYFSIFVLIIGEMALYEFLKIRNKTPVCLQIISYIMLAIFILKDLIGINIEVILTINIFLYLSSLVVINNKNKYHYKEAFYLIGLVLFLGICFSKIIYVRSIGLYNLVYLLLIAILTDSFALFIGKKYGKTKLAPIISPKKTIEGLIGGTLIGTFFSSIFYLIFIKDIVNIPLIFLMTLILSLVGELGDLIKSTIKRYEGVKDFSNLIPGHGGIMDRVDSLIFIVLFYALIISLGGKI